ncbi:glycosyltransferase [Bizionia paragorgiae]|uniref:glycosyltransferase n=1 Tax=Bizionia paragorgiae TaxID=283786 RepID=UPI003A8FF31C
MKIIRLSTFLDFGGVEKRLTNVASVQDDNDWIFCAINKGGQAQKEILAKNKKAICLNLPYKIPNFKTLYKLYVFLKNHKPDVIHTSGAEANFHGVLAAKLAGVPKIIAEEIGVPNQGRLSKLIFSVIYKLADKVVGNSVPVINYLQQNNDVPESKVKLIPNPIIFKSLENKRITNSVFKIISVSRLEPVKNIKAVINVVKRLNEAGRPIHYDIVGSGSEETELKKQVEELNLKNCVSFLGFNSDPYPFLLNADVYVINSFTEGFSNSLIEAMYSGMPSVSTKSGSAEEIIEHGVNGWLVEVGNENDLLNTLKHIMKLSGPDRTKVGLNGKTFVEANYSLDIHINHLIEIYQ